MCLGAPYCARERVQFLFKLLVSFLPLNCWLSIDAGRGRLLCSAIPTAEPIRLGYIALNPWSHTGVLVNLSGSQNKMNSHECEGGASGVERVIATVLRTGAESPKNKLK